MSAANIRTRWNGADLEFYDVQTGTTILKLDDAGAVDVVGTLKLGGVTVSATPAELNTLAGVTAGTSAASKAVVLDATSKIDALDITSPKIGGVAVTATATEINRYSLTAYMADAGTAGSVFVVIPHGGTIKGLSATNGVANATTETVLGAKIATVAVTHPAWKFAVNDAAGTNQSVVPSAANVIGDNAVLELTSDGGTDATMPVIFTVIVER